MLTRNLDKAREAYKKGDVSASIAAHKQKVSAVTPPVGGEHHIHGSGQYIKSAVYGGLDGTITTFAVVAGVAGASLSAGIVLILGFANLIADGISMAVGDYLSTKSEQEYHKAERRREAWEVDHFPEGEKQEMEELYTGKGMSKKDAKAMTAILSKNKKAWVDVMMVEELGIVESNESPLKNALVTFCSFALFGFIPLIAYILSKLMPSLAAQSFIIACVLTGATLFSLGALKIKFTERNLFLSGFEMLILGGITAIAAYGVGWLLSGLM